MSYSINIKCYYKMQSLVIGEEALHGHGLAGERQIYGSVRERMPMIAYGMWHRRTKTKNKDGLFSALIYSIQIRRLFHSTTYFITDYTQIVQDCCSIHPWTCCYHHVASLTALSPILLLCNPSYATG